MHEHVLQKGTYALFFTLTGTCDYTFDLSRSCAGTPCIRFSHLCHMRVTCAYTPTVSNLGSGNEQQRSQPLVAAHHRLKTACLMLLAMAPPTGAPACMHASRTPPELDPWQSQNNKQPRGDGLALNCREPSRSPGCRADRHLWSVPAGNHEKVLAWCACCTLTCLQAADEAHAILGMAQHLLPRSQGRHRVCHAIVQHVTHAAAPPASSQQN